MHRVLRKLRTRVRHQLLDPVLERLDPIEHHLGQIEQRLDELQVLLEQVSVRSSARTEASLRVAESDARSAQRLEELERLLGAR